MKRFCRVAARIVACSALVISTVVRSQGYPAKPVKLISPFPAGGGSDVVARILSPKLAEASGQQFLVENRTGAAGNVGADFVAKSPADGYTLLVANNTVVTNPALAKTPFDVVNDFAPVALVGSTAVALAVHPDFPAKSVIDLVKLARESPGKFSYSSCGNGTAMHLAGELFKVVARVDIVHIAYRGCGPAIVDGVGGQVPILFNTITNTAPQARGGKLRVLALASPTRSPVDTAIPVISESAGFEGFDADIWFGILSPAGTPREVVLKLNADINRVLASADVRERLAVQLFAIQTGTPEKFGELIRRDLDRWSKLVKDANIKGD
ncbi:MAG: tripartite tricarboxylate transporter substrate binding protein [Betaproteobacteria bacterium]|nr:tripartite tricarboxylate transporter substrate binding protein [Betaproteobacteria bacterium]